MKNRQIFRALSLLAALCIAAGCNQSAAEETTTTTAAQTNSAVTVMEAAKTTAAEDTEKTDPEISESIELEIDYVDEDGIVYYKNPTEWTYEKVFSALTINGKSVEAPLTIEKMGKDFSFVTDTIEYLETDKVICAKIAYKDKEFATISLSDCKSEDDINNKEITLIVISENSLNKEILSIYDINIGSKRNDIISSCGVPFSEDLTGDPINDTLTYTSENGTMIFRLSDNHVKTIYILLNA